MRAWVMIRRRWGTVSRCPRFACGGSAGVGRVERRTYGCAESCAEAHFEVTFEVALRDCQLRS